jgi:hypothetical protein
MKKKRHQTEEIIRPDSSSLSRGSLYEDTGFIGSWEQGYMGAGYSDVYLRTVVEWGRPAGLQVFNLHV